MVYREFSGPGGISGREVIRRPCVGGRVAVESIARKTISVVSPCYNEEGNVRTCFETVARIFREMLPDYRLEHIFVDNCSTDRI